MSFHFSSAEINWSPFAVLEKGQKAPYPRALQTREGLGDRLRFVAFAELQAHHAFRIASGVFHDAPESYRQHWTWLSQEEYKHYIWLCTRMNELNIEFSERPQSLSLFYSFDRCKNWTEFAEFMANAEERGRIAGEQFYETLLKVDLRTAQLFQIIAHEEQAHIESAKNLEIKTKTLPLEAYSSMLSAPKSNLNPA